MKLKYLSLITFLLASNYTSAEVTFNGFANIRAGQMFETEGNNPKIPNFYIDEDLNYKDESLFAIQTTADLGSNLSATIQLMSEGKNDFEVQAAWAYLAYKLNDSHTLKAGKMANPIFFKSEYENVGYAHNTAKLPKSVYWGFEFSTVEGISLDSSFDLGNNYNLKTKALFGSWSGEVFESSSSQYYDMNSKDIISLSAELNKDWWSVFGGYLTTKIDSPDLDQRLLYPLTNNGVLLSGATQEEIDLFREKIAFEGKGKYWYTGTKAEYKNFIFDAEYANYVVSESSDAKNKVWYAALGYRINEYVITYSHEKYDQEVDYSFLEGVTNPVLLATGKALHNELSSRKMDMDVVSLRWDFHPSAAFKMDYFMGNDKRENVGDFKGFSVGVDLVF